MANEVIFDSSNGQVCRNIDDDLVVFNYPFKFITGSSMWSFYSEDYTTNFTDLISTSNMVPSSTNWSFTTDHYGRSNKAINVETDIFTGSGSPYSAAELVYQYNLRLSPISVSFWIKVDTPVNAPIFNIFYTDGPPASSRWFSININTDNVISSRAFSCTGTFSSNTGFTTGEWTHVMVDAAYSASSHFTAFNNVEHSTSTGFNYSYFSPTSGFSNLYMVVNAGGSNFSISNFIIFKNNPLAGNTTLRNKLYQQT